MIAKQQILSLQAPLPICYPGQKSLSAVPLPRHEFRFLLNIAICVATKNGVDPEDENNLPSLTYIHPPRTISNLYGDFVQIRKEDVLNASGLKSCIEVTFARPFACMHTHAKGTSSTHRYGPLVARHTTWWMIASFQHH